MTHDKLRLSHGLGQTPARLIDGSVCGSNLQMAPGGKDEGSSLAAVYETFKFLTSCEPTQFPISKSKPLTNSDGINGFSILRMMADASFRRGLIELMIA
jgi:hypothetical protein